MDDLLQEESQSKSKFAEDVQAIIAGKSVEKAD